MGIRGRLRFIRKPLSLIGKFNALYYLVLVYFLNNYSMIRSCSGVGLDHRLAERVHRLLEGVRHLGHQGDKVPPGEGRGQSDHDSWFLKVHDFADFKDAARGPSGRHLETSRLCGLHSQTGSPGSLDVFSLIYKLWSSGTDHNSLHWIPRAHLLQLLYLPQREGQCGPSGAEEL